MRRLEQEIAYLKVKHAIKDGSLVRPSTCPNCKRNDIPIIAHHPDYSKPLDIIWVCNTCHRHVYHNNRGPGPHNYTEYNTTWMRLRRIERRKQGLCLVCGSYPAVEGKSECEACRARKKRNYEKRKENI